MSGESADAPILDLLATMTAASVEAADLDDRTLMLVRLAALVAVDAPAASYLLNLGLASEAGIELDDVRATLAAVAPIVGTPRTVDALTRIVRALGVALEVAELADEYADTDPDS